MRSFRILTDAALLYLAQKPLIVLSVVFLVILAVTAVLVYRQLNRQAQSPVQPSDPPEDTSCC